MNELYLEFLDEPIEDGFRRRKPNSYLDFDYNSEMYLDNQNQSIVDEIDYIEIDKGDFVYG